MIRTIAGILVFATVLPSWALARPGMRIDESTPAKPISGVLSMIDPATGKDKEVLKLAAQSLRSPVIVGQRVYVASSGKTLYAIDCPSGKTKWEFKSEFALFGVAATAKTVFVGAGGNLIALDSATGNTLWTYESDVPVTDPVPVDGVVVFNSFDGPIAIDQNSGMARWRLDVQWSYFVLSPLSDHRLCVWRPDDIYVVDTDSGKPLWQSPVEVRLSAPGGVPPAAVGMGNLLCQLRRSTRDARDWSFHAFDAGNGNISWITSLGDFEAATARTVIGGGCIFCILDDHLHALDFATGKLKWKADIKPLEAGGPGMVVAGETLYIPELGGDVVAIDLKTGQPRWRNAAPQPSPDSVIRVGGVCASDTAVYVTRNDQTRR